MNIRLTSIGSRVPTAELLSLVDIYVKRTTHYIQVESQVYRTENAFLSAVDRQQARVLVMLDERGQRFSSEQLATWIASQRDRGQQRLVFAVGPADGWSDQARSRAGLLLSLGPMTLPHELARLVLAEQVYRAFTILAGHPYHVGH